MCISVECVNQAWGAGLCGLRDERHTFSASLSQSLTALLSQATLSIDSFRILCLCVFVIRIEFVSVSVAVCDLEDTFGVVVSVCFTYMSLWIGLFRFPFVCLMVSV